MEKICSFNFIKTFALFEKRLNAIFQGNTELLRGGSINYIKKSGCYEYEKRIVSKKDIKLEIDILFDRTEDDYLYYSYNIFFGINKLMFHYEPTHTEHFQPHINVYIGKKRTGKQQRGRNSYYYT